MEFLIETLQAVTWQHIVMWIIGLVLIWLAIKKKMEPALLLPMGFGAILVNIPFSNVLNDGDSAGIIQWLFEVGIEASEALPILLFIGIGAMIDFEPLIVNPKLMILGAFAQLGIFVTILLSSLLGFDIADGFYRNNRSRRRTDIYSCGHETGKQVHRSDKGGGVFLYGACSHNTAGGYKMYDYKKGTPHTYGLHCQTCE